MNDQHKLREVTGLLAIYVQAPNNPPQIRKELRRMYNITCDVIKYIDSIQAELSIEREALNMAMTQEHNNQMDSNGGCSLSIDEACEMWRDEAKRHMLGLYPDAEIDAHVHLYGHDGDNHE